LNHDRDARPHSGLVVDVLGVQLRRRLTDYKQVRDLPVGKPLSNELIDFPLAPCKACAHVVIRKDQRVTGGIRKINISHPNN